MIFDKPWWSLVLGLRAADKIALTGKWPGAGDQRYPATDGWPGLRLGEAPVRGKKGCVVRRGFASLLSPATRRHFPVNDDIVAMVENAQVHCIGVLIDAGVEECVQ